MFIQYWPQFGQLEPPSPVNTASYYVSERNVAVRQVFQDFPWLSKVYPFEWERNVDVFNFSQFAKDHWYLSWLAVGLYLLFVFSAKYMGLEDPPKSSNPRKSATNACSPLKLTLALWNLGLSLFSFIGSIRMIPQLLANLYLYGFTFTILEDGELNGGQGASGLWLMLFIYAKYLELFDTVFLVIRRRKISFLHWYHHATVLLYCWRLYADRPAVGIWFAAMNYVVHSIMYFYYFLTAVNIRPRWGILVTVLQLTQMVAGMVLCLLIGYFRFYQPQLPSHVTEGAFYFGIVIYSSYFALFLSFFLERYGFSMRTTKEKIS
eukprot:gb/GECG01002477.1/.p1 GENE.gb/GECG01002477.1/~~gb/GECG01002477.1/.p1  ORF type:complete len:320 (+),score=9.72 gb/GECG01002477.1/:1-960(+)